MSKVNALYHIVFATKRREPTIDNKHRKELYSFIWNLLKERDCYLHQIGGVTDHVHMLVNLRPSLALSDLVRDVKARSSAWLRENPDFPMFDGWGQEYFAASVSNSLKDTVIHYIKNQQIHHGCEDLCNFHQELEQLFAEEGLNLHEKDLR